MLSVDRQHASRRSLSLEQIRAFLEASGELGFKGRNREEDYGWVNQTTPQQRYPELKRSGRGLVRRYVEKMTGLGRAQVTQKILQRAYYDFQDALYQRLAEWSVAQLYRLRQSQTYRKRRVAYQPTRATQVSIGERRQPDPDGRPGYLRVDTVHQGDLDGVKGVYHMLPGDL